jgi:hypothetical protein
MSSDKPAFIARLEHANQRSLELEPSDLPL